MKLFHGSIVRGLKTIIPRNFSRRYSADPARVYSSPLRKVASIFLVKGIDDSWCLIGGYSTNGVCDYWVVCGDEQRFLTVECEGGSLYELATENFTFDHDGLGEDEWHSTESAEVICEEEWSSVLQAMLHYGVKVCFASAEDFEVFARIEKDEEQSQILSKLVSGQDSIYRLTL